MLLFLICNFLQKIWGLEANVSFGFVQYPPCYLRRFIMIVRSVDHLFPNCVSICFGCSSNRWDFHMTGTVNFLQQSQTIINGHSGSFFSFIREVWHIRSKKSSSSSQFFRIVQMFIEKLLKEL